MIRSSLSRRITGAVLGITSLMVLLAAIATWLDTRQILLSGIDRELTGMAKHLRQRDREMPPENRPPRLGPPQNNENRRLIQIQDAATGQDLLRLGLKPEDSLFADPPTGDPERPTSLNLASGRWIRVMGLELQRPPPFITTGKSDQPVRVRLGFDLSSVHTELRRSAGVLLVVWLLASLFAWIAVRIVLASILRPIRALEDAIGQLGPSDLDARVPDAAGPEELRRIVVRLNDLMDRLAQAFRREQATIANIAHELRTPVTVLRTTLEFRQLAGPAPEEAAVLATCLETVHWMQTQVANLLLLARLEAGKEPLETDLTDVALLLQDALQPWLAKAKGRHQIWQLAIPESLEVQTADGHLLQILNNLLGNAVLHSPTGSTIDVALTTDGDGLRLVVANPCPDLVDPQQLGQAFYRGDHARQASDHNGLGLALCGRLARLLGGTLTLGVADGVFTARLSVPGHPGTAPVPA